MNCKQEPDAKEGKVPALNPEKAYEILMNVFQACKIEPPPNCHVYFENKASQKTFREGGEL